MTTNMTTPGYVRPVRQDILAEVERELRDFLAAERKRWTAVDARAGTLLDAVTDLIEAGGKRIRPAFCVTGYLAAGGDPDRAERVVAAAAAMELLHACALIHDDVMDEADRRRGAPTVHVRHARRHQENGWRGEAHRFGESVAILAGDLALIYSDRFMARAAGDAALWAELRAELIVGQFMDVQAAADPTADEQLCRWIAVTKSGRYTIERPLVMGAGLAGRTDLTAAFGRYGAAVGEAFQLRDDLIDAFGAGPDATGKPAGLDFEQHKMTLLMTLAVRHDPRIRDLQAGGADAARLRALLVETGTRAEIEAHIGRLTDQGCRALDDAPLDPAWRAELAAMARQVAFRDR
ncbi:polyprenyl synthetase family protein [Jidongwangia harbinensis]|uniref:polyprenyl synthetase family protein n=1 Tax=Jidongwangia harbinensis TaxID=2878561 RepID=UPI001CDA51C1|nr:polyprenyl synthetase family protein [Jidongwangia harbinensis]MCA2211631.1 polyprenyl synthetase family protein [Jidongwangia harbinensis]